MVETELRKEIPTKKENLRMLKESKNFEPGLCDINVLVFSLHNITISVDKEYNKFSQNKSRPVVAYNLQLSVSRELVNLHRKRPEQFDHPNIWAGFIQRSKQFTRSMEQRA
ncbi:hypothetical protein HPP92_010650 [Vanilla planifolia]|uniref:Uncharacterized protein n=1 Tax=Vanilla planifolia TaxID=51239 RepID=A0A835R456_VANPL|nr:hypothetical protein HPP92_010650 [Vanilla planifolia]